MTDTIEKVQEQIRNLQQQYPSIGVADQLLRLQTELYARRKLAPGRGQAAIVEPSPLPLNLPPAEGLVFQTFVRFHSSLLAYAGDVTREQWISLMNMAASITTAFYTSQQRGEDYGSVAD